MAQRIIITLKDDGNADSFKTWLSEQLLSWYVVKDLHFEEEATQ